MCLKGFGSLKKMEGTDLTGKRHAKISVTRFSGNFYNI